MIWPSLVFVSGWGTDGGCWRDVVSALAAPVPPQFVSAGPAVLDQGRTLDTAIQQASTNVVLVGWSIGAMLALQAAGRLPPGLLCGLVLISGTPRLDDSRRLRAMSIQLRRQRLLVLEDFARQCILRGTAEAGVAASDFIPYFLGMAERSKTEELAAGLQYLRDTDLCATQTCVAVPTVVVHGQFDQVIPADGGRAMAQGISGASLDMIPDAGHALPFTHPRRVAQAIQEVIHGCSTTR